MYKNRLLQLVAVVVVVGAVATSGVAASSAYAASIQVPFKASVSGTVTPTSGTTFTLAGTGNDLIASLMGKISYTGSVVITAVDPVTGVIKDTLTETLIAANGDTLTLLCQQVATPDPNNPGVYHGVDQWTVIGGTGRFSGATGSGTGDTYVNLNAGTFTKNMIGTISAPNSN